MFGDADAAGAGRVDDEDAARAGGRDVDVVDAGAGTGDNAAGRGLEKLRVDFRSTATISVSVREIGGEGDRVRPRAGVDFPAASARKRSSAEFGRSSATTIFKVVCMACGVRCVASSFSRTGTTV